MEPEKLTYGQLTKFFVPLALQAMSQALTWPLVAMVASRGPGGTVNLSGLAQSQSVMFILGTFGWGLISSGMVYGKGRQGYKALTRVTMLFAILVTVIHGFLCIPRISDLIFGGIYGLPALVKAPARITFVASLPLNLIFMFRNLFQTKLYLARRTGTAFAATLARICATLVMAFIFCRMRWVGPIWAVVCMTLPLILETFVSLWLALPYIRNAPDPEDDRPSEKEIILFTIPLSLGTVFLSVSNSLLGAFVARADMPERMLSVYYLVMGITGPVSYAGSRIRTVVLSFSGSKEKDRVIAGFAVIAGLALGGLPLISALPHVIEWYYVFIQNMDPRDLQLVRITAMVLFFRPLTMAIRAMWEGRAAFVKRPVTVLAGQAAFLGIVATTAFVTLNLGLPGNMIGALSVVVANVGASGVIALALLWEQRRDLPVPPSRPGVAGR